MASNVAKLAKPQLRGHFNDYLNKTFIMAGIGGAVAGAVYYFGFLVRHRNRRDNFYATLDQEKEFARLRDLGMFWSVPPKDPKKAVYNWQKE